MTVSIGKDRKRHTAPFFRITLAALAMAVAVPPDFAWSEIRDPVPLPRPRPAVTAAAGAAAAGSSAAAAQGAVQQAAAGPVDQQTLLARISAYFNSFQTMQGEFIQVGPRGEESQGVFFISRPGKIRFQYKPPVRLDVIADGRSVAIRDNKAQTQDLYPLSKTPLRYLLDRNVNLASVVSDIRVEPDLISATIVEKSKLVEGKLTLIFDRQTYELRQWIVTDAQGLNTSVAIFNTTTGKKPDPALFRIYLMR